MRLLGLLVVIVPLVLMASSPDGLSFLPPWNAGPDRETRPSGRRRTRKWDVLEAYELQQQGRTLPELSARYGRAPSTISEALSEVAALINVDHDRLYVEHRAPMLRAAQRTMILDAIDPERRKRSTVGHSAFAFSKFFEAERLINGQSTANHEWHVLVELAQREEREAREARRGPRQAALTDGDGARRDG